MTANEKMIITAVAVAAIAAIPLGVQQSKINGLEKKVEAFVQQGGESSASRARQSPSALGAHPGSHPGRVDGTLGDESGGGDFISIVRMSNSLDRAAAWASLIKDADADDLKEIIEASNKWYLQGGSRGDGFEALQFREGQVFRQQALDEILPEDPNGRLVGQDHDKMRGWSTVDPGGARQWLESLDDGSVKEAFFASWYEGAVSENPALAAELFDSLPAHRKAAGIGPLVDSLHKQGGVEALVDWFDASIADPASGVPLHKSFEDIAWRFGQTGSSNRRAIEELVFDPQYASYVTPKSFGHATYHIAEHHPGDVVDMAHRLAEQNGNLGEGEMRSMVSKAIDRSTRRTINHMGNWLRENPDHALYDMSTRYFVEYANRINPEAAAAWAKEIGDEKLRAEAEQILAR